MENINLKKVFTHDSKTYIATIDGFCDEAQFESELQAAIWNHDDCVESLDEFTEQDCEDETYKYTFTIEPHRL